jgi:hypothetical protein
MKKEDSMNKQKRWERGKNDMKHRKASVCWQNYTGEMSRKESVVISRFRTGYTRTPQTQKTDILDCPFCDVRLTTDHILWQCSETRIRINILKEMNVASRNW